MTSQRDRGAGVRTVHVYPVLAGEIRQLSFLAGSAAVLAFFCGALLAFAAATWIVGIHIWVQMLVGSGLCGGFAIYEVCEWHSTIRRIRGEMSSLDAAPKP